MSDLTPHFTWEEAACPDGCDMPEDIKLHVRAMARIMEAVRLALGARPIRVTSWYRCPAHNATIGGAPDSWHLRGLAVDFTVAGITPAEVFKALRVAQDKGFIGGLESAPAHCHVDAGPTRTFSGPSL